MLDSCYEPRSHKANEVLHDVAPAASFIFCPSSITNKLPTPTFWIFLYFFKPVRLSHTNMPLHKLLPLLHFSPLPSWDTQLPLTLQIYLQRSVPPSHLLQYPNITEGLLKCAPTAHIMDYWCLRLLPSCPGLEGKVVSYRVFTSWHLTKGLAHCRCLVNVQLGTYEGHWLLLFFPFPCYSSSSLSSSAPFKWPKCSLKKDLKIEN